MKMDAGLDTGPMLSRGVIAIEADETGQSLHDKLAQLGATLLTETLPGYLSGIIQPEAQPEDGITYAPQIKKEEGEIDWSQEAVTIERLVRAFTPWPGTYTTFQGKQLKIHTGDYSTGKLQVGQVAEIDGRVAIGTGNGVYYPTERQLAGKSRTDIQSFVNGYNDFIGATLPN
jgi:methionyl-tRNA formyltransferase